MVSSSALPFCPVKVAVAFEPKTIKREKNQHNKNNNNNTNAFLAMKILTSKMTLNLHQLPLIRRLNHICRMDMKMLLEDTE